ncbi:MAG: NAD(P)(+) transhydrogenase (Re/Si-specific) subunit beta, partial [Sphingomonadaceae bacterium]|nr:NAD(P)(+) transhydrogenase (Re/Si-specific) subunit beta [Sphingomonadaceae bacterium]
MVFDLLSAAAAGHSATPAWAMLAYLASGVLFILALRGLSSPGTSRAGNRYGMLGMTIAVVTTLVTHFPTLPFVCPPNRLCFDGSPTVPDWVSFSEILAAIAIGGGIGWVIARRIAMTDMPQLVAAFHSLVGLAAVLVGWAAYLNPEAFAIVGADGQINPVSRLELGLGVAIGAITFSGSVIAFLKLAGKMSGAPILLPARHVINLGTLLAILGLTGFFMTDQSLWVIAAITVLAFLIGFLLIIPIGGADMPVVVSMLNSYSGWAAAAILSYIMCKAMNRGFLSVIAGGFGAEAAAGGEVREQRPWKRGSAEDAAYMLGEAEKVIIIPGYGMAVSQAQHALREMGDLLK